MKLLSDKTAAELAALLAKDRTPESRPRRVFVSGAGGGARTDTAVADAAAAAPQLRSVELRDATPAGGAAEERPASPPALQLHLFDEETPGESAGGALRLKPAADGAPASLVMPDGATKQTEAWTVPLRKVDENGARTLVWAKIGDPAPDGGEGEGDDGDTAPPCGHPLNRIGEGGAGTDANPDDAPESDGFSPRDPDLDGGSATNPLDEPGDGGYTPTCGGQAY